MLNREMEDEKVDDIVDDILEKVDANGDGVISQQEFVHHAMKDLHFSDFWQIFDFCSIFHKISKTDRILVFLIIVLDGLRVMKIVW